MNDRQQRIVFLLFHTLLFNVDSFNILYDNERSQCDVLRKWNERTSVKIPSLSSTTSGQKSINQRKSLFPLSSIRRDRNTPCFVSTNENAESDVGIKANSEIERIIHFYKFDWNLATIRLVTNEDEPVYAIDSNSFLRKNQEKLFEEDPIIAEIYEGGKTKLGVITGFKTPFTEKSKTSLETTPPSVKVCVLNDSLGNGLNEEIVVDLGQITTIWIPSIPNKTKNHSLFISSLSEQYKRAKKALNHDLAVNQCERAMQRLWKGRVGRGRASSPTKTLTKKQINQFENDHVKNVLRKANKAGGGMSRLVSSLDAADHVYHWDQPTSDGSNGQDGIKNAYRRIVGSECLALDAKLGGRFRRLSCTFVSARYQRNSDEGVPVVQSVTLLNGGWIATDSSVRAGEEARKFAQRATSMDEGTRNADTKKSKSLDLNFQLKTAADERITQRLECLAMGESLFQGDADGNDSQLELDVRQALTSLNLPISPDGARDALVKIGRWSIGNSESYNSPKIEPWSDKTMLAAKELVQHEQTKRKILFSKSLASANAKVTNNSQNSLEQRIDLSILPTVCIDAKSTAFRDDAIGVRPRSMTGRKVIKEASKWEILIHIIDVSDIYCPQIDKSMNPLDSDSASELRRVAESRGLSRYDLPLGPLHLLPPVALEALSFSANKVSLRRPPNSSKGTQKQSVDRCVTMWAYIDERNGNLLDIGIERTLISNPVALTFSDASDLLEGTKDNSHVKTNPDLFKTKSILAVAERNLSLWSKNHQKNNEAARAREKRMVAKELISREIINPNEMSSVRQGQTLNTRTGFQRTRGHRIVDSALDLYAFGLDALLRKMKANIPRASGSGADRGGRLGTAPLRRYIDGVAQRQALSVLCNRYGGAPMTRAECTRANRVAGKASNALNNYKAFKMSSQSSLVGGGAGRNQQRQRDALRSLARHLASTSTHSAMGEQNVVQAISTGRENEVAIKGSGAVAKCKGVKGSLRLGDKVAVKVLKLDPEKGIISVKLYK